jgi:hypothetical protein
VSSLNERQWAFLEDVAGDVVPAMGAADREVRRDFREIIDKALAARPAGVRRQFGTFLAVLRLAPVVRFGASYPRLDPERRRRVLAWFQDCPVSLFRKGFWGVKALVFMGFYAQLATAPQIHYEPSFDGNARLHA